MDNGFRLLDCLDEFLILIVSLYQIVFVKLVSVDIPSVSRLQIIVQEPFSRDGAYEQRASVVQCLSYFVSVIVAIFDA